MTIQTSGDDCRKSGEGETMREQFEAWASDNGQFPRAIERSGEGYRFLPTQNKWDVWQASRAAIEIHLPGAFRESYQSSNMVMDAEAVKERISDAGISFNE